MLSLFSRPKPPSDGSAYEPLTQGGGSDSDAKLDKLEDELPIPQKRHNPRTKLLISLAVNILLFVSLVTVYYILSRRNQPVRLLPTPVPEFSKHAKSFQVDPLYLSLPSAESDKAWKSLPGPHGRGFIKIDPKSGFNFPDTTAGLSVFHQLHCLGALRNFMWQLVYNNVDTEMLLKTWPENSTSPTYDQATNGIWHFAHCFDYLRQCIQCSGDTSLEFVKRTGPALIDGLDYPHECKNWDEIWAYASEFA